MPSPQILATHGPSGRAIYPVRRGGFKSGAVTSRALYVTPAPP
jgi:hypothetical protein